MSKVARVGVTFPPELLKDFDEIIGKMGYESRSKAIQDAVRLYVSERKWLKEADTIQKYGNSVIATAKINKPCKSNETAGSPDFGLLGGRRLVIYRHAFRRV